MAALGTLTTLLPSLEGVSTLAHTGPYGQVDFTPLPDDGLRDHLTGLLGTGRGRVAGTVKEKGTPNAPVYRKVRLIREKDGLLIRELWSHPVTGAYSFDYVDELQLFTVLSYDHTGAYNAKAVSNLSLANGCVTLIE